MSWIPPTFLVVRAGWFLLPLPLVLLWPLVILFLVLGMLGLPLVPWPGTTAWQRVRFPMELYRLYAALRGFSVQVREKAGERVKVRIF